MVLRSPVVAHLQGRRLVLTNFLGWGLTEEGLRGTPIGFMEKV